MRAAPPRGDLSLRDRLAILERAVRNSLEDNVPMIASALAYSTFFAIPSTLLLALGAFTLVAGQSTIDDFIDRLGTILPPEATTLLRESLERLEQQQSTGLLLTIAGFVLALWATTGAMTTYMAALNMAYEREDGRGFVKKRLVALGLVTAIGSAVLLLAALLVFGPYLERWVGSTLGIEGPLSWLWWIVQWPLLAGALLVAFALLHYYGPDMPHRRWHLFSAGSVAALVIWLLASVGLAAYTSMFDSFNKTWGSLSAVLVTLTWLWLSGIALLIGGEINAEVERSRRGVGSTEPPMSEVPAVPAHERGRVGSSERVS